MKYTSQQISDGAGVPLPDASNWNAGRFTSVCKKSMNAIRVWINAQREKPPIEPPATAILECAVLEEMRRKRFHPIFRGSGVSVTWLNARCRTTEARHYIACLRKRGFNIRDEWYDNGLKAPEYRRWKVYWLEEKK